MKNPKCVLVLLLLSLILVLPACSGGKSPVEPFDFAQGRSFDYAQDMPFDFAQGMPPSFGTASDNSSVVAVYDAVIDPDAGTFEIAITERSAEYHYPLTTLYPGALEITAFGFSPSFWADIKLKHPLPGSGIDGFDAQVIAIIPANPGVSFSYPLFDAIGNNSVVKEPDGYTKLLDYLGGGISGNTNPFMAYFQSEPGRVWSSTGVTEETKTWEMDLAGFGGPLTYKLVVDVSTNYPAPSTPVTDNSAEPVKIESTVGAGLTSAGGSADITVKVLDWQGEGSIGHILVEAPDLFPVNMSPSYSGPGPGPDEYVYTGIIENSFLAPAGVYNYMVGAWDTATTRYAYNEFSVEVTEV